MNRKTMLMISAYGVIALLLVGIWQLSRGQGEEIFARTQSVQTVKVIEPKQGNTVKVTTGSAVRVDLNDKADMSEKKVKNKGKKKKENTSHKKSKKKEIPSHKKSEKKEKSSHKKFEEKKGGSKKYKYHISASDKKILERLVEAEAGGQGLKGKILVANVVMNRVSQSSYPNTVKGVVYAKSGSCYQFSPVADGRIDTVKVSSETKKAVEQALTGTDYSRGAQYFMCRRSSSAKNRRWFDTHLTRVFTYGAHEFFRK
ncbi:MAG: cell wall hydrolase [Lachnospiraceae bacterium]|nr:cell wall hydrolase [Lachnospiraceae bacterium]